ncbi:MAG: oligosaccharide flippase family protein [Candidatus Thiodiazotropha taylori]
MYEGLLKNPIAKGIIVLAGGTAGAQLIIFVTLPVITRLYVPEQFGILSVYSSFLSILLINASLRYEHAIPLVQTEKEALQLLILSVIIIIAIFVFLLLFGQSGLLAHLPSDLQSIKDYWYFIPIGFLIAGLYQVFVEFGVRKKAYTAIMKTKFSQAISQVVIQITLGVLTGATYGLLIGHLVGLSAGIVNLLIMVIKEKNERIKISYNTLKNTSLEHKNYPKYLVLAGFFNVGARYLPSILLATLYGPAAAGYYFLAERVLNAPLLLVSDSIGKVVYGECAEITRLNRSVKSFVQKTIFKLIIVGALIAIFFYFLGELLFFIVFGEQWIVSGELAKILCLLFLFRFVTSPIAKLLNLFEKQRLNMLFQVALFSISVISLLIAYYMGLDLYNAITIYTVFTSVIYILYTISLNKVLTQCAHVKVANNIV